MKNNELHPSEELAKYFLPKREESPMLSAPEIEQLLAQRDMLPNQTHHFINVRRIIMTLSGISVLALIGYFAFFNMQPKLTQGTQRSLGTRFSSPQSLKSPGAPESPKSTLVKKLSWSTAPIAAKPTPRGPWSAGNDQIYADLTREELARLGIVVTGDTVIAYKLPPNDTIESMALTQHSIGGGNSNRLLPAGINPPRFYPVLMTFGSGHGVAYIIEDENNRTKEWGMVGDDSMNNVIRDWLHSPGLPGYSPIWWKTTSIRPCDTCAEIDKMRVQVGKNFPKPIFPFYVPQMNGFTDSIKTAITQLANYYSGKSEKPQFDLPKNVFLAADTVTPQEMLREMDSDENTASMKRLRSTMSRLNELVPVIVRMKPGAGAPGPNDFIFWYEPRNELFNALPPVQAALFRAKLAEPPHCLSAPNAVLKNAEITYCVAEPQEVHVTVQDLTGKTFLVMSQVAEAGDNILDFTTETLPSGMYIVTVRDRDGAARAQRLWVENAHPKLSKDVIWNALPHSPKEMIFVNVENAKDTVPEMQKSKGPVTMIPHPFRDTASMTIPGGLPAIPLVHMSSEQAKSLGIDANELMVSYYSHPDKPGKLIRWGVYRTWGVQVMEVDSSEINLSVPSFRPKVVTDGLGRKRLSVWTDSEVNANGGYGKLNPDAKLIASLIPLVFQVGDNTDSVGPRDLIFWYQPTPEFLAALPDSVRAVAEQTINGPSHANASISEIHGAIMRAIAFPNPSQGRFTLKLTLTGERNLTFTLRNLLGQPVATPTEARVSGESQQPLDFGGIAEGVYLLDITSDQDERYLERIVVVR